MTSDLEKHRLDHENSEWPNVNPGLNYSFPGTRAIRLPLKCSKSLLIGIRVLLGCGKKMSLPVAYFISFHVCCVNISSEVRDVIRLER